MAKKKKKAPPKKKKAKGKKVKPKVNKWFKETIDFDSEGRLVIKSPKLNEAIDAQFRQTKHLVIRMQPFKDQNRDPQKLKKPEKYTQPISYTKDLQSNLLPWPGDSPFAGDECNDPGPGTNCPIPPHPTDMGCGCDIRINVNCN